MSDVSDGSGAQKNSSLNQLFSWLMILLLSLAPGLILAWDWNPKGESFWQQKQLFDSWYKSNDALAERFFQATSPEFWCRESAIRFGQTAEALLGKTSNAQFSLEKSWELNFASDEADRSDASEKARPLTLFFFLENGNWQIASSDGRSAGYLLKQLFRQIISHQKHGSSELSGTTWEQRIKSLFGQMAFIDMFLPSFRLQPVPVIYQGRSYYLTWDFIDQHGAEEINAGFFLLMPEKFSRDHGLAERIVANWSRINDLRVQGRDCWPAMLTFRKNASHSLVLHPEISDTASITEIWNFFQTHFPEKSMISGQFHLQLPVEMMGKAFRIGNRIARICYTDPVSGFASLLIAEMPELPTSARQLVVRWYFVLVGSIWLLFGIKTLIFRRIPAIRIQIRVLLWFVAFAAFPAGLTIGSLAATMQDLREVKVSGLHRDLHQLVLQVEAEMTKVSDVFVGTAAKIAEDEGLAEEIFKLPAQPELEKAMLEKMRADFVSHGINPAAIILVTQGGWCFSSFQPGNSARTSKSSRALFGSILDKFLKQVDPELYLACSPRNRTQNADHRVSSISSAADFRVQQNFGVAKSRFGTASEVFTGNEFALSYLHQINLGSRPFGVLMVILKPNDMYAATLRLSLPQEAVDYRRNSGHSPDIAVYHTRGGQISLVHAAGRTSGFDKITRLPAERSAYLYDSDFASIMVPSQRMPGYVFVARLPADQIEMQIFFEQFSMILTLILLLLVVIAGSVIASIWISRPLRAFIPDLESIRSGKGVFNTLEGREDEISSTASSIRRMSDWIQEREKIKRFVAPQAVNHVLEKNFIKAGAGTMRKAIILVSDIRSFTTISEEYPAEDVFDMVNHHLSVMAGIIEKWGGVIDRFVGDAVWAIFYEDNGSMANKAVAAALEMRVAHLKIQTERSETGNFTVRTGTGLARGEILAGIMGNSGVRLDYTIVGKPLHDAEDAETASKLGKYTGVVVSEEIRDELPSFEYAVVNGCDRLFEVVSVDAKS